MAVAQMAKYLHLQSRGNEFDSELYAALLTSTLKLLGNNFNRLEEPGSFVTELNRLASMKEFQSVTNLKTIWVKSNGTFVKKDSNIIAESKPAHTFIFLNFLITSV